MTNFMKERKKKSRKRGLERGGMGGGKGVCVGGGGGGGIFNDITGQKCCVKEKRERERKLCRGPEGIKIKNFRDHRGKPLSFIFSWIYYGYRRNILYPSLGQNLLHN